MALLTSRVRAVAGGLLLLALLGCKDRAGMSPFPFSLLTPANLAVALTPPVTFTWTGSKLADSYTLEVATNPGFTALVTTVQGISGTSQVVASLPFSSTIFWRVTASNGVGSQVTAPFSFTTPGPPGPFTLTSPANAATGVNPLTTFQWSLSGGAISYTLEVATDGAFSTIVVNQAGIASTSFTLATPLPQSTQHFWRVTAVNAVGTVPSSAFSFTTVAPPSIATGALPGGTIGAAYSATIVVNGGLLPLLFSITLGSLPPGLSLDPATGAITGTPTTAGTFNFTVTVTDSETPPSNSSQPLSIAILPAGARYLFVANSGDATLSTMTWNAPQTRLRHAAYSMAGGTTPRAVAVRPGGGTLYAVHEGSNQVAAYAIDALSGRLTSLGAVASGAAPKAIAVHSNGGFAFVADSAGVSSYTIGGGGALTPLSTIAAGTNPSALAIAPSGTELYVTNEGSNTVSMFLLNAGTGALAPNGTVGTASNPSGIVVSPSGGNAYVSHRVSASVQSYSIAGGLLTSMGTLAAGSGGSGITITPSGQFVYVANENADTVSVYSVGGGGALSSLGSTGAYIGPSSIAVDPSGLFLAVTHVSSYTVLLYLINQGTGGITQLTICRTRVAPRGLAWMTGNAFSETASHAYVGSLNNNSITTYSIDGGTGALTSIGTAGTGAVPQGTAIDDAGKFLFVPCENEGAIRTYTIDAGTGLPAFSSSVPAVQPWSLAIESSARFLYCGNRQQGNISMWTINPTTGALTAIGGGLVGAGANNRGITVDPTGRFAYAPNFDGDNITRYTIDPVTGALTLQQAIPTGNETIACLVDPSGRWLYVAAYAADTFAVYSIDPSTGAIALVQSVAAGDTPGGIVFHPDGLKIYHTNDVPGVATRYTVTADTGFVSAQTVMSIGANPWGMIFNPSGSMLYVTHGVASAITWFPVDAAGGVVGSGTTITGPPSPGSFVIKRVKQ